MVTGCSLASLVLGNSLPLPSLPPRPPPPRSDSTVQIFTNFLMDLTRLEEFLKPLVRSNEGRRRGGRGWQLGYHLSRLSSVGCLHVSLKRLRGGSRVWTGYCVSYVPNIQRWFYTMILGFRVWTVTHFIRLLVESFTCQYSKQFRFFESGHPSYVQSSYWNHFPRMAE